MNSISLLLFWIASCACIFTPAFANNVQSAERQAYETLSRANVYDERSGACYERQQRPVISCKLSSRQCSFSGCSGDESLGHYDFFGIDSSTLGSPSAHSPLGRDRVPSVGSMAGSVQPGARFANAWHHGPEHAARFAEGRQEAFYMAREIDRRERDRFIRELQYFNNQKIAYSYRVAHKKDGSMSAAEIAKEESENETMLPWVVARLEGRSMDQKGVVHWPYITNERGLIRGWDAEHAELNNIAKYNFRTSLGSAFGERVRNVYNYALYLNMISFSYKNSDYLLASNLALDLVEQADQYFANPQDHHKMAERFLGYAERVVDYKTGRYVERGYDQAKLRPAVKESLKFVAEPSDPFGYELIRAANALDELRVLGDEEWNAVARTTVANAVWSYEHNDFKNAYRYVDNLWTIAEFAKGFGLGAAKEAVSNFDVIENAKGLASLLQFSTSALANAYEHASLMKISDFKDLIFSAVRSSPEIMNHLADALEEQGEAFIKATPQEKGSIVGTVAAAAATFFFNPGALVNKAGKASKVVGGMAKAAEEVGHDVGILNRRRAFNEARDRANVPRSQQFSRQWEVGNDPKRRGMKNYVYDQNPSAHGRYYEYTIANQEKRVVVEHLNDPHRGPHFHAGKPNENRDPRTYDFQSTRYVPIDARGDHHIDYR